MQTPRMPAMSAILGILLVAVSPRADAQFVRTGGITTTICGAVSVTLCDVDWSVRWFNLGDVTLGGFYQNAPIVFTGVPAPPWAPNQVGIQQWIGAANNGTIAGVASRYYFQTTFTQAVSGNVGFGLGWDNRLVGAYVGGSINLATGLFVGGTSLLPGVSPATPYSGGQAGFCRSDGVFPAGQWPNCVLNLLLGVNAAQSNTLTFAVEGDGTTDGLLVGAATGSNEPVVTPAPPTGPTTTVPEPATITLLATGLAGMAGFARRRNRT